MTIAAGFVCSTGLILCADTQETWGDIKYRVPKITVYPSESDVDTDRRLIIAGAGDAKFIDRLSSLAWQAAQAAQQGTGSTLDAIEAAVSKAICDEHLRLLPCYHPGHFPTAELLFGIWAKDFGVRMYSSVAAIITPVTQTECIGIGTVLARHIIDRSYDKDMPLDVAAVLASYMLSHVKEYVEGCGGDSTIVTLENTGQVQTLRKEDEQLIGAVVRNTDSFVPLLVMRSLVNDTEFEFALERFCVNVRRIRAQGDIFKRIYASVGDLTDEEILALSRQIKDAQTATSGGPEGSKPDQ